MKTKLIYELKDSSNEIVEVGIAEVEHETPLSEIIQEQSALGKIQIAHNDSLHFTYETVPE